jgi:hypothetical protein
MIIAKNVIPLQKGILKEEIPTSVGMTFSVKKGI